ncbi:MAG TPA: type II toxin-antitoxin system Phd/YefM family antitoxin [Spirochaetota bacterium]|nr:type II toxin-antitoxin system Phd/YefM family antitoxin [Spirochaetota bacterium]HQH31792.1 type II toxin-antitoxin system Phd/YefM family antitoxin [Spirochaetota bacterium]HQJ06613.1 type II toxin-antitoxin system Phd/YefM family antitoxin [Spirochaetota bacterium]
MPTILPITDLKKTKEISKLCHNNQEPIYITKGEYGDLVIMSMETYEKKIALYETVKKLKDAEDELSSDTSLIDSDEVFDKLKKRYE